MSWLSVEENTGRNLINSWNDYIWLFEVYQLANLIEAKIRVQTNNIELQNVLWWKYDTYPYKWIWNTKKMKKAMWILKVSIVHIISRKFQTDVELIWKKTRLAHVSFQTITLYIAYIWTDIYYTERGINSIHILNLIINHIETSYISSTLCVVLLRVEYKRLYLH